jgi:hypothetical protein
MRVRRRLISAGAALIALAGAMTGAIASTVRPAGVRLLRAEDIIPSGTFRLPQSKLGSKWGFGSYTGCCGLGAYGVAFNPGRNSLYVGGHPYEQRLAEIAIPSSLTDSPVAAALSELVDPFEGRLREINPSDPNSKILASALVYDGRLYLGAYSYYDGAGTQRKSAFARPTSLLATGQVIGPVAIGSNHPGWVSRVAAIVPSEWQAALGGPAFAGGGGGAVNAVQSWGPAISVFDPVRVGTVDPVPAALILGYPMAHPLADTSVGNALWSQIDTVAGVVAVPGTDSLLFFGKHGMGKYCYGTGEECADLDDKSKGSHAYPYRSQVWAYDLNELLAVKNGKKKSYDVRPYATWELDPSFTDIQGAAFDPATRRLFVSQVGGDADTAQPLIRVYTIR